MNSRLVLVCSCGNSRTVTRDELLRHPSKTEIPCGQLTSKKEFCTRVFITAVALEKIERGEKVYELEGMI